MERYSKIAPQRDKEKENRAEMKGLGEVSHVLLRCGSLAVFFLIEKRLLQGSKVFRFLHFRNNNKKKTQRKVLRKDLVFRNIGMPPCERVSY